MKIIKNEKEYSVFLKNVSTGWVTLAQADSLISLYCLNQHFSWFPEKQKCNTSLDIRLQVFTFLCPMWWCLRSCLAPEFFWV